MSGTCQINLHGFRQLQGNEAFNCHPSREWLTLRFSEQIPGHWFFSQCCKRNSWVQLLVHQGWRQHIPTPFSFIFYSYKYTLASQKFPSSSENDGYASCLQISELLNICVQWVSASLVSIRAVFVCCMAFTSGGVTLASHWVQAWTHPKWCKMPFPAFFSVGEKLIMFIQPTSFLNLLS